MASDIQHLLETALGGAAAGGTPLTPRGMGGSPSPTATSGGGNTSSSQSYTLGDIHNLSSGGSISISPGMGTVATFLILLVVVLFVFLIYKAGIR